MVNLTNVVMAYFVIGATMFGAGVIVWDEAAPVSFIVDDPQDPVADSDIITQLNDIGGPLKTLATVVGGAAVVLIAIWDIVVGIISLFVWPLVLMQSIDAPARLTILVGGGLTTAFLMALLAFIRRS